MRSRSISVASLHVSLCVNFCGDDNPIQGVIGFVADVRGGAAGNWPGPRSASLSAAVAMSPMGLVGRFMHLMLRRPTGLQQRPDVVGSQNPFVSVRPAVRQTTSEEESVTVQTTITAGHYFWR